ASSGASEGAWARSTPSPGRLCAAFERRERSVSWGGREGRRRCLRGKRRQPRLERAAGRRKPARRDQSVAVAAGTEAGRAPARPDGGGGDRIAGTAGFLGLAPAVVATAVVAVVPAVAVPIPVAGAGAGV